MYVEQPWLVSTFILSAALSALVVHSFLIRRYYHLVRGTDGLVRPICMMVLAFLTLAASLIMAIMVALKVFKKNGSRGRSFGIIVIVRICFLAFTDWSIALFLIHKLRRLQSKSNSLSKTARRITHLTIQTGMATSLLMLASFILSFTEFRYTRLPTALTYCLGTTYSLSMLHTLNQRHELAGTRSHPHTSSLNTDSLENASPTSNT